MIVWHCSNCKTELLVPIQLGKRKKDRKLFCGKCAKKRDKLHKLIGGLKIRG